MANGNTYLTPIVPNNWDGYQYTKMQYPNTRQTALNIVSMPHKLCGYLEVGTLRNPNSSTTKALYGIDVSLIYRREYQFTNDISSMWELLITYRK